MKLSGKFRIPFFAILLGGSMALQAQSQRPNIVVILADDMGYADIGSFGGEISTPNLDRLAKGGVRLSQFYNNARCCPTRASIMTGLYPHDAGIGRMSEDPENKVVNNEGVDGYRGYLSKNSVTIAEVLKEAGYHTYMTGKWHLGLHGEEKWPLQRGFEKFYGILAGGSSYLKPFPPRGITTDNGAMNFEFPDDYYTTDAFADHAVEYIRGQQDERPFFLYLSFNAPHWPLQAKEEDIALFKDQYLKGWDEVKHERLRRQIRMGLVDKNWTLPEREMRPWTELTAQEQKNVAYRMAVYAAQVYSLDQNVGKVLDALEKEKKIDNTLIMFFSDNGASAEPYKELGGRPQSEINDPTKFFNVSYGKGWASISNYPFKRWKNTTYEGGVAAPFIAYWPKGIKSQKGKINHTPHHIIDLMPTILEVTGADYPENYQGHTILKGEGTSMLSLLKTGKGKVPPYFYWEHEENCAIRHGKWKGVMKLPEAKWELYDLEKDRTETVDLAASYPQVVKELDIKWREWANSHKVFPKGRIYFERYKEK